MSVSPPSSPIPGCAPAGRFATHRSNNQLCKQSALSPWGQLCLRMGILWDVGFNEAKPGRTGGLWSKALKDPGNILVPHVVDIPGAREIETRDGRT